MDAEGVARAKSVFLEARGLTGAERERLLTERCGNDAELRGFVEKLLDADEPGTASADVSTLPAPTPTHLPERIGPYRILQRIGEGGMGTVYLGEQTEPIRRKVAVKVLKAGMDSRAVLARFEAERQALALMDHANIAKVLDASETEEGRPYFAMEWVKGEPITKYCDAKGLSNRQRLELFIPVCHAIQHAHQKGVIHRDLKPSNILVMEQDGVAVPKVIDFGIAKAISTPLTEKTLHTQIGQLLGTPEYMSPEQAGVGPLDVDTRADVYSLGVLLYELLTGALPFSSETLRRAGYEEVLRIIREDEPPRPSTRVSTMGEVAFEVAKRRRTDVGRLARELRRDLDWVILKALEKDRARRYETVNAMAQEIRRFLSDEPVLAGPPSAAYRTSKFMRRHRVGVTLALVVLLASVTAAGSLSFALIESNRQRRAAEGARAEAEAVRNFLTEMLRSADPAEEGKDVTVRQLLDKAAATVEERFTGDPLPEAEVQGAIADAYSALGFLELALPHTARAFELRERALGQFDRRTIDSLELLAYAKGDAGENTVAVDYIRETLRRAEEHYGSNDSTTIAAMRNVAVCILSEPGTSREAESLLVRARGALDAAPWRTDAHEASLLNGFYFLYQAKEDWQHQLEVVQREAELWERQYGRTHRGSLAARNNLGLTLGRLGRSEEACACLASVLEDALKLYGESSTKIETYRANYGSLLKGLGRGREAEAQFRAMLEARRRRSGEESPKTLGCRLSLADCLREQGRIKEALREVRGVLDVLRTPAWSTLPRTDRNRASAEGGALLSLGVCLVAMDSVQTAEPALLEAEGICRVVEGPNGWARRQAATALAELYDRVGKPERAEHWRHELKVSGDSSAAQMGIR